MITPSTPNSTAAPINADQDTCFGITDLDIALRGPDGSETRALLLERISELLADIQSKIKKGLSAATFEQHMAVACALRAARTYLLMQAGRDGRG